MCHSHFLLQDSLGKLH